jgi:hypothetical protein
MASPGLQHHDERLWLRLILQPLNPLFSTGQYPVLCYNTIDVDIRYVRYVILFYRVSSGCPH